MTADQYTACLAHLHKRLAYAKKHHMVNRHIYRALRELTMRKLQEEIGNVSL